MDGMNHKTIAIISLFLIILLITVTLFLIFGDAPITAKFFCSIFNAGAIAVNWVAFKQNWKYYKNEYTRD
jgi:hypothetical protein